MTLTCDQQPKVPLGHHRADLGEGCKGYAPLPPDDLWISNMTSILRKKKKTMWFIGVEVKQAAILIM